MADISIVYDRINGITGKINGELTFDEALHQYYFNGVAIPSATQVLQAVGITKPYPDSEFIRQRAEFGTLVHKEIETFEKTGKNGLTAEFRWWANNVHHLAEKWLCEVMVVGIGYGGTCDAVGFKEDGSVIIIDHKTGTVNLEAVTKQLNLYRVALILDGVIPEDARIEMFCYDAKGDNGKLLPIPVEDNLVTIDIMHAYANRELYKYPAFPVPTISEISGNEMVTAVSLLERMSPAQRYDVAKHLGKLVKDFEDELKQKMIDNGWSLARTSDGTEWTLTQYEQERFSKKLLEQKYKSAQKIIKKCTEKVSCTKLTYKGKR